MDERLRTAMLKLSLDPNECSFLKVPSRRGSKGNAVFLAFAPGQQKPSCVIKLARDDRASNELDREANVLKALEKIAFKHQHIQNTIPRIVHYDVTSGVLVETSLMGKKLRGEFGSIADLGSHNLTTLLGRVSCWLEEFHSIGLDMQESSADMQCGSLLAKAVYEMEFEQVSHPKHLSSLLEKTLGSTQAPAVICHGDFNPYNILIADRQVSGVYDWEDWIVGSPLLDRFHLVTVMIGHLPYRDIHQFPSRVIRHLLSKNRCTLARNLVQDLVVASASRWKYDLEYINFYYAFYLYHMMEKEIRRADPDSMQMWKSLLDFCLGKLDQNPCELIVDQF